MPAQKSKSEKKDADEHLPRDPYEVLGVSANCSDQEIKSAYRKKALKYHPDKNANDPAAAEMFKEVIFAYDILSDPEKRQLYDEAGFEAVGSESKELELDLSTLGAVDTIFAALFSKLGVQIKTTVSANVLEEARNGTILTLPLPLGQVISRKVEKHCAHFYSVTLTEDESRSGLVFRAQSPAKSKFKLLYFDREEDGGLSLALQEDSRKTGKISSAGMYFLGFPVYRFDQTSTSVGLARNPDAGFFKKLDEFHPCEITELKAGSHVFAVYGDNFFRSVSYTLEVLTAAPFAKEKETLRSIETEVISRRAELSKFEAEYEQVYARFTEMTDRCTQEMEMIDELMNQRSQIHAMYTIHRPLKCNPSKNRSKNLVVEAREDDDARAGKKKRWYNSLKFKS